MPNIPIADGFGLNLQAGLNPHSAFAKYFQQPPSFSVMQQDLASLQDVPLTAFPLKSPVVGLTFATPTALASTCPQLPDCAAASATLCVVSGGELFDPDPFDNPIEVPSGRAFLGLVVKATVARGVKGSSGNLDVGFKAGATVCMSHYQSFATTATAPTFKTALQTVLENYVIPLAPDDLSAMGVGDVATIEATGSIELSGTVNLLTAVNPLASVSSATLPATLQIKEGATIDIDASFTIEGEFQIRIQKLDATTVRMGFYRKCGADFSVQVSPTVGISAGTSTVDFISTLLGAIAQSPFPSAGQLEQAGLDEDKQEAIVGALKAAIQRRLELSIMDELHADSSRAAAFLYEISLNDLGPDGRAAIQDALKLNLSSLWNSSGSLPRGVREIHNILATTRTKGHTLKINILGIYNYTSINDLLLKGTVLTDPASGEVLIADNATATRVSGAINFLADSDKLRKVLAQSFLITAAYRCSGLIAHAPSLKASYWHFEEHARTDRPTMAANLNVLKALGLTSASQAEESLAKLGDFGRSTFYLSTEYDDALSQSLFLRNDGQARQLDEFERVGRVALQLLIQSGGADEFRLRALQNDAIWQQVKETGGTFVNLAPIFPDLNRDAQIPVIAGDYVLIEWWATTMAHMAQSLSAAKQFLSQNPPPATESPAFKKVQTDLWRQMADVASKTHDRFADPWGLVAMDLASGQRSVASAQIVSSGLTRKVKRTNTIPATQPLANAG